MCCQDSWWATARTRTRARTSGSNSGRDYQGDPRKYTGHWTGGRCVQAHGGSAQDWKKATCMKFICFLFEEGANSRIQTVHPIFYYVSNSDEKAKQTSGLMPLNPREKRCEHCSVHALDPLECFYFFLGGWLPRPYHFNVLESEFHLRKSQPMEAHDVHQTASNGLDEHLEPILIIKVLL